MPIRAARAALSASGFGAGAGAAESYWLGAAYVASANEIAYAVHVDASGNVYVGGSYGSSNAYLAKFDSAFAQTWHVTLTGVATMAIRSITTDASGNVYVCGYGAPGSSGDDWYVAKLSSAGTVTWGSVLAGSGTSADQAWQVQVDSSGNVYVNGYSNVAQHCVKFNSAGTIQWQSDYSVSGATSALGYGAALNGAETTLYAATDILISGVRTAGMALVPTASGTIASWYSFAPSDANSFSAYAAVLDPSGSYAYLAGQVFSTTRAEIVKTDLSGNVQWARKFTNGGAEDFRSVACDPAGNVYASGTSASNTAIVVKYDASGNLVWHRAFSGMGNRVWSVRATATAVYCVSYFASGSGPGGAGFDIFVAKIPADGSRTGTYSVGGASVTYGATASGASASDTVTGSAVTPSNVGNSLTASSNTTAGTPADTVVKATI